MIGQPVPWQIQRHQMHAVQLRANQIKGSGVIQPTVQSNNRQPARLAPDLAGYLDGWQGKRIS